MGGVTYSVTRSEEAGGVTLAQLNEVTERATEEAIRSGIDPATVEPKVIARLGGKIKSIEFSIGQ